MAVSDVSQKYDVIIRIFEILKNQNIPALTNWPIVPITFLILNNHQSGRLAAKNSSSAEIAFFTFWLNTLSELKLNRIPGEKLCEIEAAAKRYAKNVKQTPSDKGVEKARKYLKDNGLLAVPFDKGVGSCVMKKETYEKKLKDLLQAEQFSERKNLTDSVIMKIEKDINNELLAMKKKDEISEAMYNRLRSTGVQPARLYGLAEVHKQGTSLRPVLSLPGSSYDNLKNIG